MARPSRNRRILIVDDDVALRRRMGQAFERRGLEPLLAHDYTSALAAAANNSPQYAVVDLRLPDRDGLDLVMALGRMDDSIKAVVLSGYGSIAVTVAAMRLGALNVLAKPVDVDEILSSFQPERPATAELALNTPSLARAEWEHINRVLADSDRNVSETARRLRIHRRSLQRKLQKYPPAQ